MRLGTGKTLLFIIVVAGAMPLLTADFAWSQTLPPCDFVTGGGFIVFDNGTHGTHGNFGVGGGCKNGSGTGSPPIPYWGHLEYVDHGSGLAPATAPTPFNVHGTDVTGYFFIDTTTRDITGTARTNDQSHSNVCYCVEVSDNDPSTTDTFKIQLTDQVNQQCGSVPFYTSPDVDSTLHGGNIELHKPNLSTRTGSFSSGSCLVSSCSPPNQVCNGTCTNTATDPNNCGACGSTCPGTCIGGACFPS